MTGTVNLSRNIERLLPMQLVEFMESSGLVAAKMGWQLYLVGGTVRDLLLGRPNFDIDMVVEGDALALGQRLADAKGAKITVHSRFGTVKLQWQGWTIDVATARKETYARPGALPEPTPSVLADDLFRRDFTVNAMAVELFSGRWGQLIDLYGGQKDIKEKQIRILHEKSFVDDATRIWRAIRYEQRLDFNIESGTLGLLKRDIDCLETISGDRIRHELELVLEEPVPEKALLRAKGLGVTTKIHPRLQATDKLTEAFRAAREYAYPETPDLSLYLSLLTYSMPAKAAGEVASVLHLTNEQSTAIEDTVKLKMAIKKLQRPKLKHSAVCHLLDMYTPAAVEANLFCAGSTQAQKYIRLFLTKLRYVKAETTGKDLLETGIPAGPWIKEILDRITDARMDGTVRSKKGELELAQRWLS